MFCRRARVGAARGCGGGTCGAGAACAARKVAPLSASRGNQLPTHTHTQTHNINANGNDDDGGRRNMRVPLLHAH